MPRFDAAAAAVRLFTFKEGLLSAIAHDLELAVRAFDIDLADDRSRISGTFTVSSIEVVDAVIDGRRSPGTLSDKDKAKIQSNITGEVIPARQHPEVRFTSTQIVPNGDDAWIVRGRLELAGRAREITVNARREGREVVGETTLHQPDFGIKPYSAMLGTLKIQPDVKVEVRLPLD